MRHIRETQAADSKSRPLPRPDDSDLPAAVLREPIPIDEAAMLAELTTGPAPIDMSSLPPRARRAFLCDLAAGRLRDDSDLATWRQPWWEADLDLGLLPAAAAVHHDGAAPRSDISHEGSAVASSRPVVLPVARSVYSKRVRIIDHAEHRDDDVVEDHDGPRDLCGDAQSIAAAYWRNTLPSFCSLTRRRPRSQPLTRMTVVTAYSAAYVWRLFCGDPAGVDAIDAAECLASIIENVAPPPPPPPAASPAGVTDWTSDEDEEVEATASDAGFVLLDCIAWTHSDPTLRTSIDFAKQCAHDAVCILGSRNGLFLAIARVIGLVGLAIRAVCVEEHSRQSLVDGLLALPSWSTHIATSGASTATVIGPARSDVAHRTRRALQRARDLRRRLWFLAIWVTDEAPESLLARTRDVARLAMRDQRQFLEVLSTRSLDIARDLTRYPELLRPPLVTPMTDSSSATSVDTVD